MKDHDSEISTETTPRRWVDSAELFFGLERLPRGPFPVVLEAQSHELIALPVSGDYGRPLALSPDGRNLLLTLPHDERREDGFAVLRLATGDLRRYELKHSGDVKAAALCADGDTVAVLTVAHDPEDRELSRVSVTLTGLKRSSPEEIWSMPGGWSNETLVSWSPDGQAIAITYLTQDDDIATVIVNRAGRVMGHSEEVALPGSPNGSWISNQELLVTDYDYLMQVDVASSSRRVLGRDGGTRALLGNRLVKRAEKAAGESGRMFTTDLGGGDPQMLVTIPPNLYLELFDIAHS